MHLNPEKTIQTVHEIHDLLDSQGIFKGKSNRKEIAAYLFVACKRNRRPRSLFEFSKICRISRAELRQMVSIILKALGDKFPCSNEMYYLKEGCTRLRLNTENEEKAQQLLNMWGIGFLASTRVASAIVVAAEKYGSELHIQQVADEFSVSAQTIKSCIRRYSRNW
ncbi:hypothetical protein ACOME3_002791 [Neoechinorhynchus agilis]